MEPKENLTQINGGKDTDAAIDAVYEEVKEYKEQELELNKALAIYSDNLPYDRTRIIEETKFLLKHEIVAKYEIGKRLIVLREQESVETFRQLLDEHFPGLERSYAYRYINFTRKVAQLPKIKQFAEGGNNWTKALALLESHTDEELKQLEAGNSVLGKTLDEIDKMSYRDLKERLRNQRKAQEELVAERDEALAEVRKLKKDAQLAQSGYTAPDKHWEALKQIQEKVNEIIQISHSMSISEAKADVKFVGTLAAQGWTLQTQINNLIRQIVDEAELES